MKQKSTSRLAFYAGLVITFAQAAAGQWVRLASLEFPVSAMTASGSVLFAGAGGGGV